MAYWRFWWLLIPLKVMVNTTYSVKGQLVAGHSGEIWAKYSIDVRLPKRRSGEVEVIALRFVAHDPSRDGDASFSLGKFFQMLDAAKNQIKRDVAGRATEFKLDLGWLQNELPLDERLQILRSDYEMRLLGGELTTLGVTESNQKLLTLSQAAEQAGLSNEELLKLDKQLRLSKRTTGGRRRFDRNLSFVNFVEEDLSKKLEKFRTIPRGSRSPIIGEIQTIGNYADGPMAAMTMSGGPKSTPLSAKERRHLTVITVAQLYMEAFIHYPEREGSVIQYIRDELPWLSNNQVTDFVRQARRDFKIPLPIFRRGRLPATASRLPRDKNQLVIQEAGRRVRPGSNRRSNPPIPEEPEIPEPVKEPKPETVPERPRVPTRPKTPIPDKPPVPGRPVPEMPRWRAPIRPGSPSDEKI